jgi:hypothetical protein
VGIGWNDIYRQKWLQSDNNYADCTFTLHFRFEEVNQKFPRYFKEPDSPLLSNLYVDFGLLHRKDIAYPPLEVRGSYDYLNYNFFCEQYAKVSLHNKSQI